MKLIKKKETEITLYTESSLNYCCRLARQKHSRVPTEMNHEILHTTVCLGGRVTFTSLLATANTFSSRSGKFDFIVRQRPCMKITVMRLDSPLVLQHCASPEKKLIMDDWLIVV